MTGRELKKQLTLGMSPALEKYCPSPRERNLLIFELISGIMLPMERFFEELPAEQEREEESYQSTSKPQGGT